MTITAKLIHLPTERRRRKYRPPDPLKIDLLESHVEQSLAELDRLWADSEQLTAALSIGGDQAS